MCVRNHGFLSAVIIIQHKGTKSVTAKTEERRPSQLDRYTEVVSEEFVGIPRNIGHSCAAGERAGRS